MRQAVLRNLCTAMAFGAVVAGTAVPAGAQITVNIFAPGSYTASGHGAPFTGSPVCTFTSTSVQFGDASGWHPCTAVGNDFGAQVTGAFNAGGGQFSLSSDDGAAIFLDGSTSPFASNDGVHPSTTVTFTPSAGAHTFLIDYYECCGNPGANLDMSLDANGTYTTTTPEPASIALLGTGLAGLAPIVRRRRR